MATLKTTNTTGKFNDKNSYRNAIIYILQSQKANHYFGYTGLNPHDLIESMWSVSKQFGKTDGVFVRHFIVSFEPSELNAPEIANIIGREIIGYFGKMFQAIYAVHEDEPHLHIHIVVNAVSYIDGRKYTGTYEHFHKFENFLRRVLRAYGIYSLRYVSNKS